jgi:8-oxo-dGTP pyrophosphatase MutT (NUDIX family)
MAAGGIPIGENIYDCAIRELFEEAGVPQSIARHAQLMNTIRVQRNETDGTHDEVLYCFDLALPEHFKPQNQDGEVSAFYRFAPNEVIEKITEMTWDAGRVTADFLLRRGER